jgi:hypothetical protein
MPATANGGEDVDLSGGSDCVLHIRCVCATRDKAWLAGEHAIPDEAGIFIAAIGWTNQIAFKSRVERRVNFLAGFDHFGRSLMSPLNRSQEILCIALRFPRRMYKREMRTRKTANAGTEHCNPSTKKVVTEIARRSRIPITVNRG